MQENLDKLKKWQNFKERKAEIIDRYLYWKRISLRKKELFKIMIIQQIINTWKIKFAEGV